MLKPSHAGYSSDEMAAILRAIKAGNAIEVQSAAARLAANLTNRAPRSTPEWITVDKGGRPKKGLLNTTAALRCQPWDGIIARNELTKELEFLDAPPIGGVRRAIDDTDVVAIRAWIELHHGIEVSAPMMADALSVIAQESSHHPVRTYLDGLQWDQVPRLKALIQRLNSRPHRLEALALQRWLISAVARVYEPGCRAHLLPVLHGGQGRGKSLFLQILGGAWYGAPVIDPKEKDGQIVSTRFWITEIEEIDGPFRSTSASAWKAHVSKSHDHIRLPYGREFKDYPRTGVMMGTTNADYFLPDTTGARRHPVIHVTRTPDPVKLADDRDQIWAEACYRYRSGEQWHLDVADELEASRMSLTQHGSANSDPWLPVLRQWLTTRTKATLPEWFDHVGCDRKWVKAHEGARVHELITLIGGWESQGDGAYVLTAAKKINQ